MKRIVSCVVLTLLLASCGAGPQKSAAIDPCRLLTVDQVTALTGGAVKAPLVTSTGTGCSYAARTDSSVSLLITLQKAETSIEFAEQRQLAAQTGAQEFAASFDDTENSYGYSAQEGQIQSVQALRDRWGGAAVLLSGAGAGADQATLGLSEVLAKLPH